MDFPIAPERLAERNWRANLAALDEPLGARLEGVANGEALACASVCDWLYGRDGALTARVAGGWLGGTSMPRRVAEAMVASADVSQPSLGLVGPTTGWQVERLLARLGEGQTLLAVLGEEEAAWALRCVDVSEPLRAGRLQVVAGPGVEEQILRLAEREPGWVVPTRLVRLGDAQAEAAAGLMDACRRGLEQAGRWHEAKLVDAARVEPRKSGPVVVLAGSGFRLWNDAGEALCRAIGGACGEESPGLEGSATLRVDVDNPCQASTLWLAKSAAGARGLVAADVLRADLVGLRGNGVDTAPPSVAQRPGAGVVHPQLPWITWVTRCRPATAFTGGPDAIILADPAWAPAWRAAGWPEDRIATAGWPTLYSVDSPAGRDPRDPPVVSLADSEVRTPDTLAEASPDPASGSQVLLAYEVTSLEPPEVFERFSSRRLLWEHIVAELAKDPFLLHSHPSPLDYLQSRARGMGVALGRGDQQLLLGGCVIPSYIRGICQFVTRHGGCAKAMKHGSDEGETAAPSRAQRARFTAALTRFRAVVDPFPGGCPAIASAGLPVIRAWGCTPDQLRAALRAFGAAGADARAAHGVTRKRAKRDTRRARAARRDSDRRTHRQLPAAEIDTALFTPRVPAISRQLVDDVVARLWRPGSAVIGTRAAA